MTNAGKNISFPRACPFTVPMPEKLSGARKETFYIPQCRKRLAPGASPTSALFFGGGNFNTPPENSCGIENSAFEDDLTFPPWQKLSSVESFFRRPWSESQTKESSAIKVRVLIRL